MKKFIIIFEVFLVVYCVQLSVESSADTKTAKVDPKDMEVIKDLDLLQNWDVLGPEGPDINKMNVLNAKSLKGVCHDK